MNAINVLEKEHKVILMVISGAEREVRRIRDENLLDTRRTARMLDFFRNFISACHHTKEEEHLFARLRERNLPDGSGLMDELVGEHREGGNLIDRLEQGLDAVESNEQGTLPAVGELLSSYAALIRRHIDKENHILFPLADRFLTPEENQHLIEAFERIEKDEIGPGVHEKFHDLAKELADGA